MPRFPKNQADIVALAELIRGGLKDNPAAYKVQRRVDGLVGLIIDNDSELLQGDFDDIATAVITEAVIKDEPIRTKLVYQVIAINKAGEGSSSNTVEVVL